jgi:ferrous-iron efflux pump FieF
MTPKSKASIISMLSAAALAVVKLTVGLLTASIAVLASALDSAMDVISIGIGFIAIRASDKPADQKHQFGHGKAESIAGLAQAAIIATTASFLIYMAFSRILEGYRLEGEMIGIFVMAISIVTSAILAAYLGKISKQTESTALSAGALNFGADVWTNAGALVALTLEKWGGVTNADPVISILISLYVIVSAIRIAHEAISQLMDSTLPSDVLRIIDECIRSREPMVKGYHNLKTRQVGMEKYIEFHIEIERTLSFEDEHEISESIIAEIKKQIPGAWVTVHSDPA